GRLLMNAGAGDDAMTLSGTVGDTTNIIGGAGKDTLTVTDTAVLSGPAHVNLGAGDDTFTLNDAATISTLHAVSGSGNDTFIGTTTRDGLTLTGFPTVTPPTP